MEHKQLLEDVVIIRPILIILLVFYHAFAIYGGGWLPIEGYPEIRSYWFLDKLSYAFMLETFVFVSGYVLGYQVRKKGDCIINLKYLIPNKFKRLIVPCILFSIAYIMLFLDIKQPVNNTIYDLFNGVGHMWFLPMLFWCFIIVGIIEPFHLSPSIFVPLSFIVAIIPWPELPLRLNYSFYYFPFFYVGYHIQKNNISIRWLNKKGSVLLSIISFLFLFIALTYLSMHAESLCGSNNVICIAIICKLCQIIYSSAGLIMLFSIVGFLLDRGIVSPSPWMAYLGSLCFGVYLFQQFFLMAIYNYTNLPNILGAYWLPWVGFLIALLSSVLCSFLVRKTIIGRIII